MATFAGVDHCVLLCLLHSCLRYVLLAGSGHVLCRKGPKEGGRGVSVREKSGHA